MEFLYKSKDDTYEFKLRNDFAVQLIYLDPPFNSSLRLIKQGTKLFGISLKNNGSNTSTVEKISDYFITNKEFAISDEDFLQKLIDWNLPKFAERVRDATQQLNQSNCRLS